MLPGKEASPAWLQVRHWSSLAAGELQTWQATNSSNDTAATEKMRLQR